MNEQYVEVLAWVTVIVCVFATVQCAIKYAKRHTKIFASLTFFALCWAILLPYYGLMHLRTEWSKSLTPDDLSRLTEIIETFPAYSGLLLTMAGGPLRREAHVRLHHSNPGIGRPDSWVLTGLYLAVVPHLLVVGPFGVNRNFTGEALRILGLAFTLLGFYSIVEGLRVLAWGTELARLEEGDRNKRLEQDKRLCKRLGKRLCGRLGDRLGQRLGERLPHSGGFWSVAIVAAVYSVYETIYSLPVLIEKVVHAKIHVMTPTEKLTFSVLKLLFVGAFLFAVRGQIRPHHKQASHSGYASSAKSSHALHS